eukprot:6025748-Alexandrium_andersonii.AAC.1
MAEVGRIKLRYLSIVTRANSLLSRPGKDPDWKWAKGLMGDLSQMVEVLKRKASDGKTEDLLQAESREWKS